MISPQVERRLKVYAGPQTLLAVGLGSRLQGVVTPIGAILEAATGDTTKSPGHGGFFSSVTESRRFSRRLKTVTGSKASRFKRNARDLFYFIYAVVTRTRAQF